MTFKTRRGGAMADAGAPDQDDAPDLGGRSGGHDQPGRPPRGRHPQEPPHPVQRQPHLHLHRVHPGRRQPLPGEQE